MKNIRTAIVVQRWMVMGMARLIDANEYCRELYRERDYPGRTKEFMDTIEVAIADLCDMPTVDAVELVHGRWKHKYEKGMSYKVCSICGCRNGLDLQFNYCPNCGAKMDGGTDETV